MTPEGYLLQLRSATAGLVGAIGALSDADVRAPSLLPGWTRGHVLTHLARNAEGGTRLLNGARTGVPGYEYESVAARAAEIELGAGRPAAVLVADVRNRAEGFFAAVDGMTAQAWQQTVRWTTGHETAAALIVPMRLGEVLIHHVDLAPGLAGRVRRRLPRPFAGRAQESSGVGSPSGGYRYRPDLRRW